MKSSPGRLAGAAGAGFEGAAGAGAATLRSASGELFLLATDFLAEDEGAGAVFKALVFSPDFDLEPRVVCPSPALFAAMWGWASMP